MFNLFNFIHGYLIIPNNLHSQMLSPEGGGNPTPWGRGSHQKKFYSFKTIQQRKYTSIEAIQSDFDIKRMDP